MERLTDSSIVSRIWSERVDTIPAQARSPQLEAELLALGFRPLGALHSVMPEGDADDDGPQSDEATIHTLQLLSMEPAAEGSIEAIFARPEVMASIEISPETGTWLVLMSLLEDGTLLRTIRRPERRPPGPDPDMEETYTGWRLPGVVTLLRAARGDSLAWVFPSRDGAGLLTQILPTDAVTADLVAAHADLVARSRGASFAAPVDDLGTALAMTRRSTHVSFAQRRQLGMWMFGLNIGVRGVLFVLTVAAMIHFFAGAPGTGILAAFAFILATRGVTMTLAGGAPTMWSWGGLATLAVVGATGRLSPALILAVLAVLTGVNVLLHVVQFASDGHWMFPVIRRLQAPTRVLAKDLALAYRD